MKKITMDHLQRLAESPMVQKAIAESERDRTRAINARRAAAIAEIKDAHAKAERERPGLEARAKKTLQAMKDAEAALDNARRAYGEAFNAVMVASNAEALTVTRAEAVLIDTTPDPVREWQAWTWREFDRVRGNVTVYSGGTSGNPQLGQQRHRFLQTNAVSAHDYVAALQAGRATMHGYVLTIADVDELDGKIIELNRKLPTIIEEVVEGPAAG